MHTIRQLLRDAHSVSVVVLALTAFVSHPALAATTCPTLPTGQGTATTSFQTTLAGSYRVWAHMYAPQANDNALYLQIDSNCPVNVGGSSLPTNAFTWVDYANGDSSTPITVNLTKGTHTLAIAGEDAGVGIDRVLLLANACVPTSSGTNCETGTAAVVTTHPPTHTTSQPVRHAASAKKRLSAARLAAYVAIATICFAAGAVALVYYGNFGRRLARLLEAYSRMRRQPPTALSRFLPTRFSAMVEQPIGDQSSVVVASFGRPRTDILANPKAKLLFVACFGIVGGVLAFITLAATVPYVEIDLANATLSGQAKVVPNSLAASGQMVQFGVGTAGTTTSSGASSSGKTSSKQSGTSGGGTAQSTGSSANPIASLPLIPWEGGPAYWNQFSLTKAAGWTNPNFFPIGIWFNGISSNTEAQFDKSYGINMYFGMDTATDYNLFANNGLSILQALNNTPAGGTAQPGDFAGDELDGKASSLSQGLTDVQNAAASYGNDGRFRYFNFTQLVVGNYGTSNNNLSGQIVDAFTGPVSVDDYWYTIPTCTGSPSYIYSMDPIDSGHCRTASSYGTVVRELRARNIAGGGPLKPIWNFVENLSGAPDANSFYAYISPGQLEGAVMNSVINEARGIFYFNQSYAGSCTGSSVLSEVEFNTLPCAAPQMNAMKQVDGVIDSLAPAINTQSYQYSFGTNLNTMLKWYDGSAYIFSMISGDASSEPGSRTFTLPSGLAGASSVTVLNENRTIPVSNGKFTDSFADEYTYHIYKVTP